MIYRHRSISLSASKWGFPRKDYVLVESRSLLHDPLDAKFSLAITWSFVKLYLNDDKWLIARRDSSWYCEEVVILNL
jgi:hypothetical protein